MPISISWPGRRSLARVVVPKLLVNGYEERTFKAPEATRKRIRAEGVLGFVTVAAGEEIATLFGFFSSTVDAAWSAFLDAEVPSVLAEHGWPSAV